MSNASKDSGTGKDHSSDSPMLREALRLLQDGLWPVAIYGPHSGAVNAGKRPIGKDWGKVRPTEESLRKIFTQNPTASLGIKLGADGGVIDVEIDDPETGEDSLIELLGGECIQTKGWSSFRGSHLLFKWDSRLTRYRSAKITSFKLPGLEVRIGSSSETDKQVQSVCPPSLTTKLDGNGKVVTVGPRMWNGIEEIAPLPDRFFEVLDLSGERGYQSPSDGPETSQEARAASPPPSGDADFDAKCRYAAKAFGQEIDELLAQHPDSHNRNNKLNEAAFSLGTLIGAGVLQQPAVENALADAALKIGLTTAETRATIRSGIEAGKKHPRDLTNVTARSEEEWEVFIGAKDRPIPEDATSYLATAADLVKAQSGIVWVWKGWIQRGVLTLLAAEPGAGKTRFCLDLCRRIYLGLPWPDGQPMDLPRGSTSLWVPADNNHPELAENPPHFGFPTEAIYLNTTKEDLYGGTELSTKEQLAAFEFNIRCANPALVIVDTITNTSDLKSHDTSDAKRQYKPLQIIAQKCNVPIICVTHLNASGKTVGRRADEKVRTAIRLENPDPDGQPNRRKIYVSKSNSAKPSALGVTMGDNGNEYDTNPPSPPDEDNTRVFVGGGNGENQKLRQCAQWLTEFLRDEAKPLTEIIESAQGFGFSKQSLYTVQKPLRIKTYKMQGFIHWELPNDTEWTPY